MSPLHVLVLAAYPINVPRHGGQLRVSNIVSAYSEAGVRVTFVSCFPQEAYSSDSVGATDIPFPQQSIFRKPIGMAGFLSADLASGVFASTDESCFERISGTIPEKVSIIQIEQPWLLPVAMRLRTEHRFCLGSKLVYSSHNVEYLLKRNIFLQYGLDEADLLIDEVHNLEIEAASVSDFVLAVSADDARCAKEMGASNVVVAPNGVSSASADPMDVDIWRCRVPQRPWAIFIASAHPPNVKGFLECFGNSLACIPPSSRLVLVGSIGAHIARELDRGRYSAINRSRLLTLGEVAESDVLALKELAPVFVLPITESGGTNLKTAEALHSGATVLGTRASFRGFERYLALPNVHVCDDLTVFRDKLRELLASPSLSVKDPVDQDEELRRDLTWERCLTPMVDGVKRLCESA